VLSGFLNGTILMGVGATLQAPLLYALATLRGMRHKHVYPILRVKQLDGRLSPVEEFPGRLGRAGQDC
jgi:hypothetical protein